MADKRDNRGDTELTERFEVLMTPELRRGLERLARQANVSASAYVRMRITGDLVALLGADWRRHFALVDEVEEVDVRKALSEVPGVQREPRPVN